MAPFLPFRIALGLVLISCTVVAQQQSAPPGDKDQPPDKRIFGVLPNYRTAENASQYQPLTAHQKFTIAVKDSFDWPVYFVSAGFAGLYQLEDQSPSFGEGLKGYAHRYVTSYGDQVIGNMMTEAIMPTLLREDPRYFRKAEGSTWRRAGYAASRILVTRTDSGGSRFNFSEVVGNGITAAIGNAYYPDDRGAVDTIQRLYTQLATDAFSNVLKEFWPDIKRRWFTHHDNGADASNSTSRP
ncbi:MAG: hypothetical protein ABSH47_15700 [Bryobacteraceae bacterium]|jgi:hypothetical protein